MKTKTNAGARDASGRAVIAGNADQRHIGVGALTLFNLAPGAGHHGPGRASTTGNGNNCLTGSLGKVPKTFPLNITRN